MIQCISVFETGVRWENKYFLFYEIIFLIVLILQSHFLKKFIETVKQPIRVFCIFTIVEPRKFYFLKREEKTN